MWIFELLTDQFEKVCYQNFRVDSNVKKHTRKVIFLF